ncbi:MAG: type IX secretion system sortase PorU [bacterium]
MFEKLVSFRLIIEVEDVFDDAQYKSTRTNQSVLATGDWYKVRIDKSGVFKITYQDLSAMGFDMSVDPRNVAVFGNGGGILPERNDVFRHDDLVENPVVFIGEEDGRIDAGDYILFYGEGPVVWNYNAVNGYFEHQNNYYDDYTYYFITAKSGSARRIQLADPPSGTADIEVTTFDDFQYHEVDLRNLAGTGRVWYGELFDFNSTYEFSFEFPNIITENESGFAALDFASISSSSNTFDIYLNGEKDSTLNMPVISPTNAYQIAANRGTSFNFTPDSDNIVVRLVYNRLSSRASGYLNYIRLNTKRKLIMSGSQMHFLKKGLSAQGEMARYTLSNAGPDIEIWDITDPTDAQRVNAQFSGNNIRFTAGTDQLRKFIAFDGSLFHSTAFVEKIENQNLHAVRNIDYVIITHPLFLAEANRLAAFHEEHGGLTTYVTTPALIYNEFSSGSQDITGIRDFMKMLYDESDPGREPRYLLLFGDASYDYKDILGTENSNFVPCWEDISSLNIVHSIATDDYFGFLDDGEGEIDANGDLVDIGIGRFVVSTVEQAEMAVDKSIYYATNTLENMGPWRNIVTFLADDGDNNTHLKHGEILSQYLQENHNAYNVDKIYVDAYPQVSTPSGQRAPEVNQAINNRMAKGTLVMNYNGHGGEIGLGHERFLQISDINSWTNYEKMPIFITATCEFSRYDDLNRVSAGEMVFLNEKGGGIALFSTARATFASSNLQLNLAIYNENLFTLENGKYPTFGDVIRKSKKGGGDNSKKFVLLGDPALRLAYPQMGVGTLKINGEICVEDVSDTLKALSQITIEGQVTDHGGQLVNDYEGLLFPTIYDKKSEIVTLGDESQPYTFYVRQNILFNGKVSVTNGEFLVEFIVPRDIAYKFGGGRISYYTNNNTLDGHGYYENIIIGGFDNTADEDDEGPVIELFMNDTTFVPGGTTDQHPLLLAKVFDESGINTTGAGIGHDIQATISGSGMNSSYIINQYYEADVDSYNSGTINYPFHDLDNGKHTLTLRVWDIHNNSSTAAIDFIVVSNASMLVENLMNYPNPFINGTHFVFDHNQTGQELSVLIEIFNSGGGIVKTIETRINPEGYRSTPIYWDGSTDNGGKIGRGFYVYRVVVRNENGDTQEEHAKLLYIRN